MIGGGGCVLSHFTHRPTSGQEPKLRHGKRCTRCSIQGWSVLLGNSVPASAADLVIDLDSDEYIMVEVIRMNDMQCTIFTARVLHHVLLVPSIPALTSRSVHLLQDEQARPLLLPP